MVLHSYQISLTNKNVFLMEKNFTCAHAGDRVSVCNACCTAGSAAKCVRSGQRAADGATVLVDGTCSCRCIADMGADFSLSAPAGATTLYSQLYGLCYAGLTLTNASNYDITLETDVVALSDVVVVGYGTSPAKS